MLKLGEFQKLTIAREQPQGFYLEDDEGNEVLLPGAYCTREMDLDDEIEVFVYADSSDKVVATTETPFLTVGQFAFLEVTDVNQHGAFCDWGITKELFVPFRNQAGKLQANLSYVVHLLVDEKSNRLVGTTKLSTFLEKSAGEEIEMGQKVDLLVYYVTELGYKVIVNQKYAGLVYKNEVSEPLHPGQKLNGYVKPIRIDGKIDISINPVGYHNVEPEAQKILDKLDANKGFLPFTDKSNPELIRKEFGVSKKMFKKSIGALYREEIILIKEDGIYKV
ncbi:MAG: putative RNA-binding protein (virulence factor B family) [Limisphaerales bacterium]|jgi:predicted RNA-binding protein (virulence factor B family)